MASAAAAAVVEFREFLTARCVPGVVDQVAELAIQGLEEAIVDRNSKMHSTEKQHEIAKINHEMFLILKFVDVVFVPRLRSISMAERLPPVRWKLMLRWLMT